MKTYKQFQQNIQEIDQNLLGPGLGAIGAVGNALKFVGKTAFGAGVGQINTRIKGSTPQRNIKKIPVIPYKGK
tara:strand:+ start:1109 stop:1327 length:219 start_codon:yes stop_codon:yes gene_type:complete